MYTRTYTYSSARLDIKALCVISCVRALHYLARSSFLYLFLSIFLYAHPHRSEWGTSGIVGWRSCSAAHRVRVCVLYDVCTHPWKMHLDIIAVSFISLSFPHTYTHSLSLCVCTHTYTDLNGVHPVSRFGEAVLQLDRTHFHVAVFCTKDNTSGMYALADSWVSVLQ